LRLEILGDCLATGEEPMHVRLEILREEEPMCIRLEILQEEDPMYVRLDVRLEILGDC